MSKKIMLDQEYNLQEKKFQQQDNTIDKLQLQIENLTNLANKLKSKIGKLPQEEVNKYYSYLNQIDSLGDQIEKLSQTDTQMDYYLRNSDILSTYYQDLETPLTGGTFTRKQKSLSQTGSISDFIDSGSSTSTNGKISRTDLLYEYQLRNNPHFVPKNEYSKVDDYCQDCGAYREVFSSDSVMVCPKCGDQVDAIVECDKPSYKDSQQESTCFEYQRLGHFKDHMARVQGKESTPIPEIIYDIIKYEFHHNGHNDWSKLTETMVRSYLKKYSQFGYEKYFENVHKIMSYFGIQPIQFSPDTEEQFCNMFMEIEEPFESVRPSDRTNLISYPYVFYKFCQILRYDEYLSCFNLVKCNEKLFEQDTIWKKICLKRNWPFYPSSRDGKLTGQFFSCIVKK